LNAIDAAPVNHRLLNLALAAAILIIISLLYWPISQGGFAWDDTYLLQEAWLHAGDWQTFMFRGFSIWVNYFRPLGALLLVVETRAFGVAPEPMHVVSLGMHLVNTMLVGQLASKLRTPRDGFSFVAPAAMLFYGLHPALIEPVSWIGCHYELAVVLCTLLGLLANATIESTTWRAAAVSASFLAAMGFKEAGASFPLLLVLFDFWATPQGNLGESLGRMWRRQRAVYITLGLAALFYVVARVWALGYALSPSLLEPLLSWARLQKVCATYLHYWNLIVWPMSAIGPMHPFDPKQFEQVSANSVAFDIAAAVVFATGIHAVVRRRAFGLLILAATIALLPALNIVPVGFSESLYHDRYAAIAVAVAGVLLPTAFHDVHERWRPLVNMALPVFAVVWLGFAIINIRVTVPLWADELGLWKWALREHPDSIDTKAHLLASYIERGLHVPARELADAVVASDVYCPYCLINAADLALADKDAERARLALGKLQGTSAIARDSRLRRGYVFASGELLELQGEPKGASAAYRETIRLDPLDPLPRMALARLLARHGDESAARAEAAVALPLFAPEQRMIWQHRFEQTLSTSGHADEMR
jgi:hypothetical protein